MQQCQNDNQNNEEETGQSNKKKQQQQQEDRVEQDLMGLIVGHRLRIFTRSASFFFPGAAGLLVAVPIIQVD